MKLKELTLLFTPSPPLGLPLVGGHWIKSDSMFIWKDVHKSQRQRYGLAFRHEVALFLIETDRAIVAFAQESSALAGLLGKWIGCRLECAGFADLRCEAYYIKRVLGYAMN